MAHNLRVARSHAGAARVFAVVKANAYGHGLSRARRALAAADGFAVLTLEEAANLRLMGVEQPIMLLEGLFGADEIATCAELDLSPVLHHAGQLDWLERQPPARPIQVFLKFDSGMHRLGFPLAEHAGIVGAGAWTVGCRRHHLDDPFRAGGRSHRRCLAVAAVSARTGQPRGCRGAAPILQRCCAIRKRRARGRARASCCTARRRMPTCRPAELGLRPAMSLQSEIISVQTLQAGEGVGYGQLYRAERAMRVGVVACGYADGYPRHALTGTPILVNGRRSRTLGRVSMDMLCVDLGEHPDAGIGSSVELWGEGLPVDAVAAAAGTNSYELLCALAARVPVEEAE